MERLSLSRSNPVTKLSSHLSVSANVSNVEESGRKRVNQQSHLAIGNISSPCLAATSARARPTLGVETQTQPKQKSGHVLRGKASHVGLHFAPMLPFLVVLQFLYLHEQGCEITLWVCSFYLDWDRTGSLFPPCASSAVVQEGCGGQAGRRRPFSPQT